MRVLQQPSDNPVTDQNQPAATPEPMPQKRQLSKRAVYGLAAAALIIIAGLAYGYLHRPATKAHTTNRTAATTTAKTNPQTAAANLPGLQLDANKNYGNKYADGLLPVGDGKYVTTGAKAGYVYVCDNYATNLQSSAAGAGKRGPWFVGTTQYDINKKISVQGSVMWQAQFTDTVSGGQRKIVTNDLPDHRTGVFPISAADPAYAYDRNPNSIKGQTFTYDLNAAPSYGDPSCAGGQVGVMLTGVAMFSGFDAGGRDAGAWEVQDSCQGHPQSDGIYHYHTLSSCITDASVKTVIGFALDGFPITGPRISDNNILTSSDLDECHGITSQVVLDGKKVTTYHYVMTQDFPYSVACYRGTAIQAPGQGQHPAGHP